MKCIDPENDHRSRDFRSYVCNCLVTGLVISQLEWTGRIKQIPESQHPPPGSHLSWHESA